MKKSTYLISLVVLSVVSLTIGAKQIDLFNLSPDTLDIIIISRLPRLLSILISGMGLSLCGLIMQNLSHNKFVSPSTAGTMDSARLGVVVVLVLMPAVSILVKIVVASLFAFGGSFLFMMILNKTKVKNPIMIPLIGMMLGGIINAFATMIAYRFDLIQNMNAWLQGNFALMMQGRYEFLFIAIPLMIGAYLYANQLMIAGLGKDIATNLGLNYQAVVMIGLMIVAAISSLVLLTVGAIPFVGIIIPNIVALYRGDQLKKIIPETMMLGGLFVLICDIIGRLIIFPYELPIALVVGLIGSGLFAYLILRQEKHA